MHVIGSYASPYVRKVLITLALKELPYTIDPLIPFLGNDAFARLSPLRRVPVLIDGEVVVNDSTIICDYLDEIHPGGTCQPATAADRARARWIEEYCDSRMGDVFIWKLFNQRVIGPGVLGRPTREELVLAALETDIPQIMDWLEGEAPRDGFLLGGTPGIADITPACFLRNGMMAGWTPDATRWPHAVAWMERVWALEAVRATAPFEKIVLSTRVPEQRQRLIAAGAPVSEVTLAGDCLHQSLMGVDR